MCHNGKSNGFGRYLFIDGGYYAGQFKAGLFDGKGMYVTQSGQVIDGLWKKDIFKGEFPQ